VTASRARLAQLLGPVVAAVGPDLEEVSVSAAGRRSVVRVVVDRDGGASLDDIAEVSRVVSTALDELDQAEPAALGASYVLEVSSPGVDRPLTQPRHWRRSTGRLVSAHTTDGGSLTGRVASADDQADGVVVLELDSGRRTVRYADLVRGTVQVEFARPASGPAREDS